VLPSQGKMLSEWVNEELSKSIDYSKKYNMNFKLIESTPFNFKGSPAQTMTFTSRGVEPVKTMNVYITNGNNVYILTYFASLSRYPVYLPIIQKMIDSFQIKNVSSTTGENTITGTINSTTPQQPQQQPSSSPTTQTGQQPQQAMAQKIKRSSFPSPIAKGADFLTYQNSTYGIRIQYPSDWKYKEEQGIGTNPTSVQLSGLTIATFNPTTNTSTSNPPNTLGVVVQVQNSPFNNIDGIYMDPVVHESLKYQVIKSINSTANLNDIASVIEKKILSLIESNATLNLAGNNPARKLEYKVFGGETRVMDVFTIKGNTLYRIIYYAKSPEYGRYLPIAQRMINSFTMVNTNLSSSIAKPYQINYWQRYFLPYENSSLGIKIHYPSDWYKTESNDMPNTITFTCKYHCDIGFVTVKAENIPFQGVTLNDYSGSVMQIDKRLYPDFNIVEFGKATILGGIPVQRLVFTGKVGEQTIKEMDLFMIKDNKIYQIRFGSTIYQYPFILPVVQKMIDSFQIVNTTTTTAKTISTIWQR